MIKTFENCSPEYQITIVWFFIFLTLLCMILVIYEGTARKHNTNMNRKLGITVREELMLYIELFRKCDQLDKLTYSRTE